MRKSILFESQPAPCRLSRRLHSPRALTPFVVLAAITALSAIQLRAQAPAAKSPPKPAAPAVAKPQAAAAPKPPAHENSKPQKAATSRPPAHAASKPAATKVRKPVHRHKHSAKAKLLAAKVPPVPVPVTPPPPEPPHWPANERPADATVIWDGHGLLVSAQNSSLKQILESVAAATGAKVEGLGADQRIFGTYGPGRARDVLTMLLDGTGYNILMIGDQGEGTPRQIVLTSRNASGSANATAQAAANAAPPPPAAAEEDPEPNEEPPEDLGARRLGRHGNNHEDPGGPPR